MDTNTFIVYITIEDSYEEKMLKQDLTLQIMNQTDRQLMGKNKKSDWINKR